ncbi:MAG: hypothetical protein P4L51_10040 [Puia sp.]|nr:hypothetical protein [Puia sp.]
MRMDIFHNRTSPDQDFRSMDWMNSRTTRFSCKISETTGYYNMSVRIRLLGHYRRFQHFRTGHAKTNRELPAAQAYILQYRSWHGMKYFGSRSMLPLEIDRHQRQVVYPHSLRVQDLRPGSVFADIPTGLAGCLSDKEYLLPCHKKSDKHLLLNELTRSAVPLHFFDSR